MDNNYVYIIFFFGFFLICCNANDKKNDFKCDTTNSHTSISWTLTNEEKIEQENFEPFTQQFYFPDKVEGFYEKNINDFLVIYDTINGNKIDSLSPLGKDIWYKITIKEFENRWIKIDNIWVLCDEKNELNRDIYTYKDKWIKSEGIKIDLGNEPTKIYSEPNENSKFIKHDFATAQIIDVYKSWAKIEIIENNGTTKGWIKKTDQCPLPYTTCNYE